MHERVTREGYRIHIFLETLICSSAILMGFGLGFGIADWEDDILQCFRSLCTCQTAHTVEL